MISLLSGYFKYVIIFLILIIIHELGHLFAADMFKYELDKIIIYPFGGKTKYTALLNSPIINELVILLFGFIFQFIFYFIIYLLFVNNYITNNNFLIVKSIHYYLILFNSLPIIPLDGSKFLNLMLELVFSYKKANLITIYISVIILILLLIFNYKLLFIFIAIILFKSIVLELYDHKYKINKFLIERLLYKFNFKRGRTIKNIYEIKRNKTHKIISKNRLITEREYLENLFDFRH